MHSGEPVSMTYLSINIEFSLETNSPVRNSVRSGAGEVERRPLLRPARCNSPAALSRSTQMCAGPVPSRIVAMIDGSRNAVRTRRSTYPPDRKSRAH